MQNSKFLSRLRDKFIKNNITSFVCYPKFQREMGVGGFSLIELIVSTAIFASSILVVTGIFEAAVKGQRAAISSQNTQESMRYAFEMMSKELRSAFSNDAGSDCPAPGQANKTFNLIGGVLHFKNSDGVCVSYSVVADRIQIRRGADVLDITPDEVRVVDINYSIIDDVSLAHTVHPRISFAIESEMKTTKDEFKQNMIMQTTVSSRSYD